MFFQFAQAFPNQGKSGCTTKGFPGVMIGSESVEKHIHIYIYIHIYAPYLALGTRPWNVFGGCGSCLAPMREHSLTCGVHGCIWPSLRNLEWKREREACRTAWEPGRLLGGSLSKMFKV
jgi:hypothetical protein